MGHVARSTKELSQRKHVQISTNVRPHCVTASLWTSHYHISAILSSLRMAEIVGVLPKGIFLGMNTAVIPCWIEQ